MSEEETEKIKKEAEPEGTPAWDQTLRPLKGYALGSIYVGTQAMPKKQKGGKKWVPPRVPMEAPKFCLEQGFSKTTCFECELDKCYFETVPERINKKRKETKAQARERVKQEASDSPDAV